MFRPVGAHVPSGGKRWAASGCSSARMGHTGCSGVTRCEPLPKPGRRNSGSLSRGAGGAGAVGAGAAAPVKVLNSSPLASILPTTYYLLVAHVTNFCCGNFAQQPPSPCAPSSPTSPNSAVEILHSSPRRPPRPRRPRLQIVQWKYCTAAPALVTLIAKLLGLQLWAGWRTGACFFTTLWAAQCVALTSGGLRTQKGMSMRMMHWPWHDGAMLWLPVCVVPCCRTCPSRSAFALSIQQLINHFTPNHSCNHGIARLVLER